MYPDFGRLLARCMARQDAARERVAGMDLADPAERAAAMALLDAVYVRGGIARRHDPEIRRLRADPWGAPS